MNQIDPNCEEILNDSPCGTLVLDESGRIQQLNPALARMLDLEAAELLGKNKQNFASSVLKGLFEGNEPFHIPGPGLTQSRWLKPVATGKRGNVRFFLDITEQVEMRQALEQLQQQVDELTITDRLTGLANQRALNRALNQQVTRSRRYQNPLSLAVVEVSDATDPDGALDDEIILATSRYLRDRLRWVDMIARWDDNHFVILLPETNAQAGTDLIEKICREFTLPQSDRSQSERGVVLRAGLAQWEKGNDPRLLMERAVIDLNVDGLDGPVLAAR